MASNNVAQFAAELKMPAGVLLEQLQAAGVQKASEDDVLSEADKARLLDHLRKSHGSADTDKRKITLTRRHTSEIKQSDATGKARTIQVEVRKKRVFVKRDEAGEGAADAAAEQAPAADDSAELQRREEEARREAELLEQQAQELHERQERLEREEAERQAREKAAEAERQRAEEEASKKHAEDHKHAEAEKH
ncbi:MAG: translation initiation factor IF-2 associated domain-containing protein, partial [Burkholderiales bacterium]|nr:translation initiation factor IF-2 associated domain-containing protein [Burkholderiales bacterium]